jgi:DNA-binding NarL/FixJ family response regulator
MLDRRPDLQIVGEVSDGLEAVQKAEELQPHLILLDVGLPSLNGIEAARQIRKLSPKSKILFVSQESAVEVVQEALNLGAWENSGRNDLLPAVEEVRQGKRFVSAGLAGRVPADVADRHAPERLQTELPALSGTLAWIVVPRLGCAAKPFLTSVDCIRFPPASIRYNPRQGCAPAPQARSEVQCQM